MGVKAGIPDIVIPVARKGYHGLYLELKRVTGGVISEQQKNWLILLEAEGYLALVAKGFEHAVYIVEKYFDDKFPEPIIYGTNPKGNVAFDDVLTF